LEKWRDVPLLGPFSKLKVGRGSNLGSNLSILLPQIAIKYRG